MQNGLTFKTTRLSGSLPHLGMACGLCHNLPFPVPAFIYKHYQ